MQPRLQAIVGSLLGTAVGDAIGLPYEGLSRRRAARLLGEPDRYRFFFDRGMVSDDTEHTCLVVQSLIASGGDVDRFTVEFARRLRWWILGLPAGVGLATLRASFKLWLGFPPSRSGVFSAGNGPAMRAAVLGATIDDLQTLKQFVCVSTQVTHRDPKAEHGALAVALAARFASKDEPITGEKFLRLLHSLIAPDAIEFLSLVSQAVRSAERSQSTPDFAASLGLDMKVRGYVYHTVPVALHAWLSHPNDFRAAVIAVIRCGGDADTMAAIVGGIVGAAVGKPGIPIDWLAGLWEWPRSVRWMEQLATQLQIAIEAHQPAHPPRLPVYALLPRNLLFLLIVLFHGFRRLFPPY